MANCKQCGQEYEAKRSTSHYCSPKCKQEFYRNRMSTVTPESVTARPAKPVTVIGHKRGKDIKVFADLPPDVQQTIDKMSDTTEEHIKRTEAAINYQHLYPDRYYSTGVV